MGCFFGIYLKQMGKLLALEIGKEFKIGSQGIGYKTGYESVGEFISRILPNVFVIAGIILFFLILLGGFSILTASGDKEKVSQGSKTLTAALVGFVIIFAAYWIIQVIEVITGISIFKAGI
jgi:hypothetical protein